MLAQYVRSSEGRYAQRSRTLWIRGHIGLACVAAYSFTTCESQHASHIRELHGTRRLRCFRFTRCHCIVLLVGFRCRNTNKRCFKFVWLLSVVVITKPFCSCCRVMRKYSPIFYAFLCETTSKVSLTTLINSY